MCSVDLIVLLRTEYLSSVNQLIKCHSFVQYYVYIKGNVDRFHVDI